MSSLSANYFIFSISVGLHTNTTTMRTTMRQSKLNIFWEFIPMAPETQRYQNPAQYAALLVGEKLNHKSALRSNSYIFDVWIMDVPHVPPATLDGTLFELHLRSEVACARSAEWILLQYQEHRYTPKKDWKRPWHMLSACNEFRCRFADLYEIGSLIWFQFHGVRKVA